MINKYECIFELPAKVTFTCAEAKTLRVSVNSFFDLLHLVNETIEKFDECN